MKNPFLLSLLLVLCGCAGNDLEKALAEGCVIVDAQKEIIHASATCTDNLVYMPVSEVNGFDASYVNGYCLCSRCIPPSKIEYVRGLIIKHQNQ